MSKELESPAEPIHLAETSTGAQPLKWNRKPSLDFHGLFLISRKRNQTAKDSGEEAVGLVIPGLCINEMKSWNYWPGDAWAMQKENAVMRHQSFYGGLRITKKGLYICETLSCNIFHVDMLMMYILKFVFMSQAKQYWIQLGGLFA